MTIAPWLLAVAAIVILVSWLAIPDAGARIVYAALMIAAVPTHLITRRIRDGLLRSLAALVLLFVLTIPVFWILAQLFWR